LNAGVNAFERLQIVRDWKLPLSETLIARARQWNERRFMPFAGPLCRLHSLKASQTHARRREREQKTQVNHGSKVQARYPQ
jgi:hypothetical protein